MAALAFLGLFILLALSIFQLLLILGKPLGDFAWGGQHKVLPKNLRISSAISIMLYVIFAIFLASKAGIVGILPDSPVLTVGMWVFTVYFAIGFFMNLISRNPKERMVMAPTALLLAIIFLSAAL